jgi:Protein of unknown function (DUF3891)
MIRRQVGNEFWLIPQHDHALLSGELAKHVGNQHFARPTPLEQTIEAVSLHDSGWPLHDEQPTLNKEGLPIDVFESTPEIGFKVWAESARQAAEKNPYTGLLVSLHSLSLSALAVSQAFGNEKFDPKDMRVRFEVNKFQHAQIELQEKLRKQLGMRTDVPLMLGLAEKSNDPAEQSLLYNFRLLQAMDKLSLCICCTRPPFGKIEAMTDLPGGRAMPLNVSRPVPEKLIVEPWPFDSETIEVSFPFRRLSVEKFADETMFREKFAMAPWESFRCQVCSASS